MLDKDTILSISETRIPHEVVVDEWGGSVFVRSLSGRELDCLMADWRRLGAEDGKNAGRVLACVVAATACDETGELIFENSDIDKLHTLPVAGVKLVAEAALEFNGLTEEMQETIEGN